jgi:hypothetical protein
MRKQITGRLAKIPPCKVRPRGFTKRDPHRDAQRVAM